MTDQFLNLIELLQFQAASHDASKGYTFLPSGEEVEEHLSFAALDRYARGLAQEFQRKAEPGDRVLILLPPGLDYLAALFGCVYSGLVAVTAFPPKTRRTNDRLSAIIDDCKPRLALTSRQLLHDRNRYLAGTPQLGSMPWVAVDRDRLPSEAQFTPVSADRSDLAVLQYTSGTTGQPKGVMLSHANLLEQIMQISRAFELRPGERGFSWLPPNHDMGLIGTLLSVLGRGGTVYLMPPTAFIQQPFRWLRNISRFQVQISGGPNFAYELCLQRITDEQLRELDLSHWEIAFNGAEPVSAETIERFSERFAPCGFRQEAFLPCYGLAEATLIVTAVPRMKPHTILEADRGSLEQNHEFKLAGEDTQSMRRIVGCGPVVPGYEMRIVDPDSSVALPECSIGEIWLAGSSVAGGYWNRIDESNKKFRATLDDDGKQYLRTGDFGFVKDGELFVTGRMDDLMIIRGRNLYARDMEQCLERSHPSLHASPCAVFTVDQGHLVVVQEASRFIRESDFAELCDIICASIAETFDVSVHDVVFTKPFQLPRTSSGKVRRSECKRAYLHDELPVRFRKRSVAGQSPERISSGLAEVPEDDGQRSPEVIEAWLLSRMARHVELPVGQIDPTQSFARYGLDSVTLVGFAGELETFLGRRVRPTLLYDAPTIREFAERVAQVEETETPAGLRTAQPRRRTRSFEPVAIIGVGCRFPDAETPDAYWDMLRNGRDGIGLLSDERAGDMPPALAGMRGGYLDQVDRFDAAFFNIAPSEAVQIDPQHRLLLEVAWESLEYAGIPATQLAGESVGVFVGVSNSDYARVGGRGDIGPYFGSGTALSMGAHRLSYHFNFNGPSMAVDTACSSSLVAVHLACQSLHNGDSSVALAGGVNLILSHELSSAFTQAQMLSPKGRCGTFDASADGYVRGEGCGLVVMKLLADAVEDGDRIMAVIKGSAINQDGRSNGITAPHGDAQLRVIREAMERAGAQPGEVSYIETHGTGTILGDPIEFAALRTALASAGDPLPPCALGAVKTNLGHLESAAGVAGLIKVVLALQHREIPPNLHFEKLNPNIDLVGSRFLLPTERRHWVSPTPRSAGISSFGFGGTNAHLILEEAPQAPASADLKDRPRHLLTLSAKTEAALGEMVDSYVRFLDGHPEERFADVCHSANCGRVRFPYRLAATAGTQAEMVKKLRQAQRNQGAAAGVVSGQAQPKPQVAFLFTGQGAQYTGMARQLYDSLPMFRDQLDRCDHLLQKTVEDSIVSLLYSDQHPERLNQTLFTQPALFAIEYSLARTLRAWGIEPVAVSGHSLGEYVAACVAGVLTLEDALELVAHRGKLMQNSSASGCMASVFAPLSEVERVVARSPERLSIAAVNTPEQIVISGEKHAVEDALADFERDGVAFVRLNVSHAFHSPLMDETLAPFRQVAEGVRHARPKVKLISNLTGSSVSEVTPDHWVQHLRETVHFWDGVDGLVDQGISIFVEIGPHPVLTSLVSDAMPGDCTVLPTMKRGGDDWQVLLDTLAKLHVAGVEIDFAAFECGFDRRKVALPSYPFERKRYWIDTPAAWKEEARLPVMTQRLAEEVEETLPELRDSVELDAYCEVEPEVDRLIALYAQQAVRQLSLWPSGDAELGVEEAVRRGAVTDTHGQLFERVLEMLAEESWLRPGAHGFLAGETPTEKRPQSLRGRLVVDHPQASAELTLVGQCGAHLAEVLSGRRDALDVLFPNGSAAQLESLYEQSPIARYHNTVVQRAVEAFVRNRPDGDRLRILEIGAGTGGTTSYLLESLDAAGPEYVFTDVSKLFLMLAAEKFARYPWVQYRPLDIESPLEEQGFTPGAFDLVIAANVLHATADLRATTRTALELLAPAGQLLLLEGTRPSRLLDLIFGMTPGWWKFADTELRPTHPLISADQWIELLQELGARSPQHVHDTTWDRDPGQAVILAGAPLPTRHYESPVAPMTRGASPEPQTPVGPPLTQLSRSELASADVAEQRSLVERYLRERLGHVLGIAPEELDLEQPVNQLGLDSLMALQVKNRIESELGVAVSVVTFLQGMTLAQLITKTLESIADEDESDASVAEVSESASVHETTPGSETPAGSTEILDQLDSMTSEQLDSVLAELLRSETKNEEADHQTS